MSRQSIRALPRGTTFRCWSALPVFAAASISPSDIRAERINVGDRAHRFETVAKVIAGQDEQTLDIIAAVYGSVVPSLHRAPSIKVAEAAKIIENTQRDLNVALTNEFSAICHTLDIDTMDVIAAAGTK